MDPAVFSMWICADPNPKPGFHQDFLDLLLNFFYFYNRFMLVRANLRVSLPNTTSDRLRQCSGSRQCVNKLKFPNGYGIYSCQMFFICTVLYLDPVYSYRMCFLKICETTRLRAMISGAGT